MWFTKFLKPEFAHELGIMPLRKKKSYEDLYDIPKPDFHKKILMITGKSFLRINIRNICLYKIKERRHTRGERSSRTCKARHINLGLKASKPFQWHIKDSLSRDAVSS